VLEVEVAGGDERVDAGAADALEGLGGAVQVLVLGAAEGRDGRAVVDRLGDLADRLEVVVRRDREAALDDVDPQLRELLGERDLLGDVHGEAGRLLAVAQGRIKDDDFPHGHPRVYQYRGS
jgi:hypothetical protein